MFCLFNCSIFFFPPSLHLLPLPGVVPPVWGVFSGWLSDSVGWCPGNHLLPGSCVWWRSGRSYLWDPGCLHLTLHFPHPCYRAAFCLCVQLHGIPVSWDVPPLWHHGVSGYIERKTHNEIIHKKIFFSSQFSSRNYLVEVLYKQWWKNCTWGQF